MQGQGDEKEVVRGTLSQAQCKVRAGQLPITEPIHNHPGPPTTSHLLGATRTTPKSFRTGLRQSSPNGRKQKTLYGKIRQEVATKLAKALSDRDDSLTLDANNMNLDDYLRL